MIGSPLLPPGFQQAADLAVGCDDSIEATHSLSTGPIGLRVDLNEPAAS